MASGSAQSEPYVGPKPFSFDERDRFFARDVEIDELLSLVVAHRAVLLYSESGAGKTSLLVAGLRPALEGYGLEVLPVARVRDPAPKGKGLQQENVYTSAAAVSLGPMTSDGPPSGLAGLLAPHAAGEGVSAKPRTVMFDQFEELFTYRPEHWRDREGFFDEMAKALEADPLLRVLFAIREDYLAQLDPYMQRLPDWMEARYRLERLRPEAALVAIQEPLRPTAWQFASGVAERLVEDLRTMRVETRPGHTQELVGEFVEPVQLQVVCHGLWQSLPAGGGTITAGHLKRYGDVTRALSAFYETALQRAVAESGEDESTVREWFDTKLLTPAGTRGIVYRGPRETEGIRNEAVDALEQMHLVRGDYRAGARWYELTHDRFIGPIQESNRQARRGQDLLAGRGGRLIRLFAFLGGISLVGLLILPWIALPSTVRGLVLRVLAMLILAFLPGWLYVSFLQSKMKGLWDEYVLNLFRLRIDEYGSLPEPPLVTSYHRLWEAAGGKIDDSSNFYLRKFEAIYGRRILAAMRGYRRITVAREALTVVLVFSLISALGWWFVLRPDLLGSESLLAPQAGTGDWPALGAALQFAFIGAYLYGFQQIIREYADGSLRGGTYIRVSVRVVVVAVIVVLGHLLLSGTVSAATERGVAFLIAIFPQVGLQVLRAALARPFASLLPTVRSDHPLSDLDGLTVWDESRLLEEGIEDMQNLVTANLVDILLRTRMPVSRLVDWLDQAFLYLRLSGDPGSPEGAARQSLRVLGIRTATDLERAWDSSLGGNSTFHLSLGRAFGVDAKAGPVVAEALLESFSGEPNLSHVRAWKQGLTAATDGPSSPPTKVPSPRATSEEARVRSPRVSPRSR